jgi:hypothetical protein
MFPLFSFEWFAYEIGKFVGFRLTERVVKKFYSLLKGGVPKTREEIFTFDRNVRYEAAEEVSASKQNILLGMSFASNLNNEELFNSLAVLRKKLDKIASSIESAQDIMTDKESSAKGLIYLDFILLSNCFALNEQTRDLLDKIYVKDYEATISISRKIDEHIRKLDRLLHMRATALNVPDKQFLRFLETEDTDVYEAIRSLAILAYLSEEKKGFFKKGEYYKSLISRSLYAAKVLEDKIGPEIDFKTFFIEFRKMYPDIEVSPKDLEKALNTLAEDELILNIEYSDKQPKVIWTKLDYRKVLEMAKNKEVQNNGLTLEELIHRTGWSTKYATRLLEFLEEKGLARKGLEPDGTARWFFPGIKSNHKISEIA